MKRFRLLYLSAFSALLMFTACQSDPLDEQQGGEGPSAQDSLVEVRLRISPADAMTTNAPTRAWVDGTATDAEMMNIWTVVIVNSSDKVVEIQSCRPSSPYAEIDDLTMLPIGTYRFYSFANMSAASIETLLGLPTGAVPTVPAETKDVIISQKVADFASTDMGTVGEAGSNNITAAVSGNKFDPTAADNGFGEKGIPMSNVQTGTISMNITFDLIVVRMLAKIELRFYNVTGKDINIKKIAFSDVTKNPTNTDTNLKLLPNLTYSGTMEYYHEDIQPNLNPNYTEREDIELTYSEGLKVNKEYNNLDNPTLVTTTDKYTSVSFYVNETSHPAVTALNPDGLFQLTLELDDDDYRYTLVSSGANSGITVNADGTVTYDTKRNENWKRISRNDYRIIPIVLDGYRLEMMPYDFPEIGVYPASVYVTNPNDRISQQIYQIDFHDYGHFHLIPKVVRDYNDGSVNKTDEIPFSNTSAAPGSATIWWTLYGAGTEAAAADWTNSFRSFTDATAATEYTLAYNSATDSNPAGAYSTTQRFFYGKPGASGLPEDNVYPTDFPVYGTDLDGSENGDWPVLDVSTQWSPSGAAPYRPFIFGQIAPQEAGADKYVFHAFQVYLYVSGAIAPRVLTYRFYMHLIQDHGLASARYVSRLRSARPSCGCHQHVL